MKVLVTGANGFVGRYLISAIQHGFSDETHIYTYGRELHHNTQSLPNYTAIDILDRDTIIASIKNIRPDVVIHLAAQANVGISWTEPESTFQTNVFGTLNLLDSCAMVNPECLFLFISTADVYGLSFNTDKPVTEQSLLQPMNPYAVSKASADMLVRQYGLSGKLKTVCCRPFNHIGPGQSAQYVVASIAKQIAEIVKLGAKPILSLGNIEVTRDFLDVRDVVNAYCMIIKKYFEQPKLVNNMVFNVCSSQSRSIKSIVDDLMHLTNAPVQIESVNQKKRPNEVLEVSCSNQLIVNNINWKPQINWRQTLNDIFNYWYQQSV